MITKTEARRRARAILSRGWHRVDVNRADYYVFYNGTDKTPAFYDSRGDRIDLYGSMGRLSHKSAVDQLTKAIIDWHIDHSGVA